MPKKETIVPAGLKPSSAPLSYGTRFGNMVFVSGMVAHDSTGKLVEGGIREQARQTLDNLKAVLEAAGCTTNDVLRTTCYLADINDRPAFNEVYALYFPDNRPARTCFGPGGLGPGVLLEVEAIAGIPD